MGMPKVKASPNVEKSTIIRKKLEFATEMVLSNKTAWWGINLIGPDIVIIIPVPYWRTKSPFWGMAYLHNGKTIVDGCTVIYTVATHNKIEQLDLEISWNYGQHSPLLFLSGLLWFVQRPF